MTGEGDLGRTRGRSSIAWLLEEGSSSECTSDEGYCVWELMFFFSVVTMKQVYF